MAILPKSSPVKPTHVNPVPPTNNDLSQNMPFQSNNSIQHRLHFQTNIDSKKILNESLLNTSIPYRRKTLLKPSYSRNITILVVLTLITMTSLAYFNFSHTEVTKVTAVSTQNNKVVSIFTQDISSNLKVENLILDVDELTNLSVQLKRSIVQSSSLAEQTLPMLVSLSVKDLMLSYRAPLDLVCVLDHSGSMSGDKIELLKNTFKYLLHFLEDFDRLAIVMFDHEASTLVPLLNTTASNKKRILSAVNTISPQGGTNINSGVNMALNLLKQREQINQVTSLFVLSDGLDNGEGGLQRVRGSLFNSGLQNDLVIHTFGFGRDHDPELMTNIADLTDGSFYFIDKLDQIDEAFVQCLGALQSSIAENVQITVRPEQSQILQGVEIVKAYGDLALWTQKDQTYVTKMTNLMNGIQKDYVLELKLPRTLRELPSNQISLKVASVEAVITIRGNEQVVKMADLNITLLSETEEVNHGEEDNREVMKHYYRVKGALLMEEARKMSDEGRHEEAKKMLESFKEGVENSFLKEEEFVKDMIKDLQKAIDYVNPDVYEMYGRHNLIGNHRDQMRQKGIHLTNTAMSKMAYTLADLKNE